MEPPAAAVAVAAGEEAPPATAEGRQATNTAARRGLPMSLKKSPLTYWVHGVRDVEVQQYFDALGWSRVDLEENPNAPPLFARHRRTCKNQVVKQARIRPFPYATCVSYCCDKKLFYTSMMVSGYTKSVPETYLTYDAFAKMHDIDSNPPPGETWFVKTSDGCHGRGVNVFVDYRELRTHVRSLHNEPYVIQRGVSNLNLIDGKKWTLRTHVLVTHDLQIYRHREGVVIVHSQDYELGGTNRASQILHDSRAQRYSWLGGPASHLVDIVDPQVERVSFEILDCVKTKFYRAATGRENAVLLTDAPVYYSLLGLDWIVDANNVLHCLEVNEFPQMDFSNEATPDAHNCAVAAFRDFLRLVVYPMTATQYDDDEHFDDDNGWVLFERQLDFEQVRKDIQEQRAEKLRAATEALSPGFRKPGHRPRDEAKPPALPHSTDDEKLWFAANAAPLSPTAGSDEEGRAGGGAGSPSAAKSPQRSVGSASHRHHQTLIDAASPSSTSTSTAAGAGGGGGGAADVVPPAGAGGAGGQPQPRLPTSRTRLSLDGSLRDGRPTAFSKTFLRGGASRSEMCLDDGDAAAAPVVPRVTSGGGVGDGRKRFTQTHPRSKIDPDGDLARAPTASAPAHAPNPSLSATHPGRRAFDSTENGSPPTEKRLTHALFNAPPNPPPVPVTRPAKPMRQVLKMHNVGVRVAGRPAPPPPPSPPIKFGHCAVGGRPVVPQPQPQPQPQQADAAAFPSSRRPYTTIFPPPSHTATQSVWPAAVAQIQSQMTGISQVLSRVPVERMPRLLDPAGTLKTIWMTNRPARTIG